MIYLLISIQPMVAKKKAAKKAAPKKAAKKVAKKAAKKSSSESDDSDDSDDSSSEEAPKAKAAPAKVETAKKGNAYVYRMVMFVDNVDKITPELVKMMKTLGAEKAGEVELGWRRKGGSYFHFTIPQSNNQLLQDSLKKYSNFNLIKSSHPRVMPDGIERFILWVEEKKSGEEASGSSSVMPNTEGQSRDGTEAP